MTDWDRLRRMTDKEINAARRADPDAGPEMTEDWLASAARVPPLRDGKVEVRLDLDILHHFWGHGRNWESRMNAVLRTHVEAFREGLRMAGRQGDPPTEVEE